MSDDIKIVIKKGDTPEGTSPSGQTESVAAAETPKKEEGKPNVQMQAVNAAVIQVGKQMLMTGLSKYGDLTGDYATTRNINAVMSIGADIATIAVAGPAGAVLVAGKYVNQFISSSVEQFKAVREHEFQLQRMGTISKKGSRY